MGLPLHLWNSKIMKEIGDTCGGWLESEEEIELKNHLRWEMIRVRGPKEKIPVSIEVVDDDLVYSLSIWCELPAAYQKRQGERLTREGGMETDLRPSQSLV